LGSNESLSSQFLHKDQRMRRSSHIPPQVGKIRDRVQRRVENAMRRNILGSDARRVLDVGTGFGSNVRLLAQEFKGKARVWSIDPSSGVLREVRHMLRADGLLEHVKLIQAKAEEMPFDDGFFTLVTSAMSIHHFVSAQDGLSEMVRVLADKGRLVLTDWRPLASEIVPHRARDFARPERICRILSRLGVSTRLRRYHYWYMVRGNKTSD